ncbi:hypothetical protein BG011_009672 [Mortierella polycephala]|uniref:Crinkler effector protein N-terminal domain-containing protein n=1 Tax=Mortierella polycephala TaxID=41804 RepID=A0A9P6PNX8_9FUNG|nr:hypothetical protein BG011_009672 [Mortierella polycephala]
MFKVDDLKGHIKKKREKCCKDIEPMELKLWGVSIKDIAPNDKPISLDDIDASKKTQLLSTTTLHHQYYKGPTEGYIHIIVELPLAATPWPPRDPHEDDDDLKYSKLKRRKRNVDTLSDGLKWCIENIELESSRLEVLIRDIDARRISGRNNPNKRRRNSL